MTSKVPQTAVRHLTGELPNFQTLHSGSLEVHFSPSPTLLYGPIQARPEVRELGGGQ